MPVLTTYASLTLLICNDVEFLCCYCRVNRDYVNRYFFYKQKSWQCETTGKSGLTYEEALESEHKEKSMVANKFPPQLRKPLLEFSQFRKWRIINVLTDACSDCNCSGILEEGSQLVVVGSADPRSTQCQEDERIFDPEAILTSNIFYFNAFDILQRLPELTLSWMTLSLSSRTSTT